ncbi:MAG TPA: hypothetical protein VE442_22940 [Jatrophihabitans sp.]|nr:hypothetical protein [Jatrophihabitans sp.]
MNPLERQLSALLKEAPGEPAASLDVDALLAQRRPRRRYLAPLLAAAAVVAIATPLAVILTHGPAAQQADRFRLPPGDERLATHPRQAAIRTAQALIKSAPVLPRATRVSSPPLPAVDQPPSAPGAQHVQRTAFWTAPESVGAAITYLKSHPPKGMTLSGTADSGGPSVPTVESLTFGDYDTSLQLSVVAFRGGVAVRADAQVLWAPRRSPADMVPASVTSVDVTIVRSNPQQHLGAPTVRRTLTGDAARALADYVNALPRAVPNPMFCPNIAGNEEWSDTLVFHSAGATTRVVDDMRGCTSITFRTGHRKPIQLSGGLNQALLHALGLPANYGAR